MSEIEWADLASENQRLRERVADLEAHASASSAEDERGHALIDDADGEDERTKGDAHARAHPPREHAVTAALTPRCDGLAHVDSNVRARPPTSAEELEETRAEFAAQDAAREAAWRK